MPAIETTHVLLVDDSLNELQLLSAMLRAEHFRLTVASDGLTGYQRALVSQPDVILMDVVMPKLDGFGACRLLKADPATKHIPVIFLTAKNEPQERLLGLQLGGVDYVSKPVLEEEVIARIRIHLNRVEQDKTHHIRPNTPPAFDPDDVVFKAATDLIRDQLQALPPLPDIARMVGSHEKKMVQLFRDRLGMTVSAFAGEERIGMARQFLEDTNMSIQSIAEQVGYGNAGNFTTAFRKRMGMTPSVYRQALRDQASGAP